MRQLLGACAALAFLAGTAYGMGSKPSVGTGDRDFDSTLEKIAVEANESPDGFIRQLASGYDIPEREIRAAIDAFHLGGPDIFMATALARATQRPVLGIAERYQKNPGKGWGRIAKDLGIKPGSGEFHDLKNGASRFLEDVRVTAVSKRKHAESVRHEQDQARNMKDSQGRGSGKP